LLKGVGFYKTVRFKDPSYLGDPLNILRIFNEKEADEIIIFDIEASTRGMGPRFDYLAILAGECFMPLGYGGGVSTIAQMRELFRLGFEKVVLNSNCLAPRLIEEAAATFGSQSIVVCIDARKKVLGGYATCTHAGTRKTEYAPADLARLMESRGAGEIIINSIDRDGTLAGYDLDLIRGVAQAVSIPVVASGGARNIPDFKAAITEADASACAAGAMFVYQGRHRAVLINVPTSSELDAL
jgi:cyclase